MSDYSQIFTMLFLMLGPFKILRPFLNITKNADPALARQIATRATALSVAALLLAALLGERILNKYSIPVSILALSGGIILFLVALLKIINQFVPADVREESTDKPSLSAAMNPLAFPTIVTPYGIAAVIVFTTLSPDFMGKLTVFAMVAGIMMLNFLIMLFARHIFKPLALVLTLLGSVLGIVQVALGVKIIYTSLTALLSH